tara:strand:- start:3060 stop:3977 length:918 start_codon:yes stop_codon:yes gene_type:complete
MKKILVTGGSGLVGKHLQDILPEATYLCSNDCNLTDINAVDNLISQHKPDIVIHLAARVGGILDNLKYPVDYLEQNVLMNTNLLSTCHKYNVKNVIAILSTCIYPDIVNSYPMTEKDMFNGPPTPSNFSYGLAKRTMAAHIDSYVNQYNKKWCYLIPCNLYGEYDKFSEHNSHFVAALIKKIHEATNKIILWGSGKPLRQFIYGGDLAIIIKKIIDTGTYVSMNVAPPWVYSIDEMARIAIKSCCKSNLKIEYDNTKPDGQFRKDVRSNIFDKFFPNFKFTSLSEGIQLTYSKVKNKPIIFRSNE